MTSKLFNADKIVRKITSFFVVCLTAMMPFSSAHANPLQNLGFESISVGAGAFAYNAVAPGWVFSGGSGIASNGSGFTSANPVSPEGLQVAFLQNSSSFSQQFTTAFDFSMSFTFAAAQRARFNSVGQNFNVLLDNIAIGHFQPTSTTYLDYLTTTVNILTGNHTLTFTGLNFGPDNTAFIDNIRVASTPLPAVPLPAPIPTPATSALLLTGLGLIGFTRRRKTL
jgi:hypothetical protein